MRATKQTISTSTSTAADIPFVAVWALIFLSLTAVYYPSLRGDFLWDDGGHVTRSDLRGLDGLGRIWTEIGATQQYYPVLHSAFWVEHRLWGDSATGYRLTNIALHALAAAILVVLLRRLGIAGALFAASLWALHPVMVESVAWISEQKNTLSGVFYLASAYVYLMFDTDRRRTQYAIATILFACAVASKSVTATLPAALLVVIWWRRGHVEWRRDVRPLLPWFGGALCAGLISAWVEYHVIGAQGTDFSFTALERCQIAGRVFWFYVAKLAWPVNLTFIYPRWPIDSHRWVQFLPLIAAIAAGLCAATLARTRAPLASWLFFVVTLAPVLGFLNVYPFRFSFVADHFQYLASLGVIVPVSASATALAESARWRPLLRATAIGILAVMGTLSWHQSSLYVDNQTLWRANAARNPDSWLAYMNLGTEFAGQKRFAESVEAFERAARLNPRYAPAKRDLVTAHLMYAALLAESPGTRDQAAAHFDEALKLDASNERAHVSFGNLLVQMGKVDQGVREYRSALQLDPDYFRAHYNLGTVLLDLPGREGEAVTHLEAAVALDPSSAEARLNLAVALADTPARIPEAIKHLEAALAIRPDLAQARELLQELRRP